MLRFDFWWQFHYSFATTYSLEKKRRNNNDLTIKEMSILSTLSAASHVFAM